MVGYVGEVSLLKLLSAQGFSSTLLSTGRYGRFEWYSYYDKQRKYSANTNLQKETRGSDFCWRRVPVLDDKQERRLCGLWCHGCHPTSWSQAVWRFDSIEVCETNYCYSHVSQQPSFESPSSLVLSRYSYSWILFQASRFWLMCTIMVRLLEEKLNRGLRDSPTSINNKDLGLLVRKEAENICKDNIWSSFLRVLALSSVICRPNHLFYASVGFQKYQKIFNQKIYPRERCDSVFSRYGHVSIKQQIIFHWITFLCPYWNYWCLQKWKHGHSHTEKVGSLCQKWKRKWITFSKRI